MSTKEANTPAVEQTAPEPEPSDDVEVIREQIEETRAELGDTVEALAARSM